MRNKDTKLSSKIMALLKEDSEKYSKLIKLLSTDKKEKRKVQSLRYKRVFDDNK